MKYNFILSICICLAILHIAVVSSHRVLTSFALFVDHIFRLLRRSTVDGVGDCGFGYSVANSSFWSFPFSLHRPVPLGALLSDLGLDFQI